VGDWSLVAQRPQQFPDFAIDPDRVLRRRIDQLHPPPIAGRNLDLLQQICGLQNCLQRVAQIVGQYTQTRNLLRFPVFGFDGFPHFITSQAQRKFPYHFLALTKCQMRLAKCASAV